MSTPGEMNSVRIILLGSTGSIGAQTLAVIDHLNTLAEQGDFDRTFEVVGLAAGGNAETLATQAERLGVRDVALADTRAAEQLELIGVRTRTGDDAATRLVEEVEADMVLGAIVGFAGLPATLAAIERGCDVLLANKETLVAAGELVTAAAERTGVALLPIDSEHSGVWQCLASRALAPNEPGPIRPPVRAANDVTRVTLTASGGAFRDMPSRQLDAATPVQALRHPTWNMGAKVTIDSASLTNKALELIEARWLFGLDERRLDAVIHPTSTVHALVEFADGSVIAQLGDPDMRTPIQYALTWPARVPGISRKLSVLDLPALEFRVIEHDRYPAVEAGYEVIRRGGTAGAVFNAANEAAVEAFVAGRASFAEVRRLGPASIDAVGVSPIRSLDDVTEADAQSRRYVEAELLATRA